MHAVTAETATDHGSYVRKYINYKKRAHAAWHAGLGMQGAVSFSGVEGLIPVVSVRSHNVLLPLQLGLQTRHSRHKPLATTHLPSLPSIDPLSVAEDERARSLAAFSK